MSISIFDYLNEDEIQQISTLQRKYPQTMMHLTDYISALAFDQVIKALKDTINNGVKNAKTAAPIVKGGETDV